MLASSAVLLVATRVWLGEKAGCEGGVAQRGFIAEAVVVSCLSNGEGLGRLRLQRGAGTGWAPRRWGRGR